MKWRIELLGGLRAINGEGGGDASPVTRFESRKTAALLAILALHPHRAHPREELAAYLWPDADFAVGRNRLKQALASLRRVLEPPGVLAGSVLEADRFALRLRSSAFESDVVAFDGFVRAAQWQRARDEWRGELLPGFYEEPILLERERLNAVYERVRQNVERGERAAPPLLRPVAAIAAPDATAPNLPPIGVRSSLPDFLTPFFGRDAELARLAEWLATERWVTLTGPGGFGKTRLSVEAARAFDGDVWFAPLAEAEQLSRVPEIIARAMGVSLPAALEPWEALARRRAERPTLLVADNAEQLVAQGLAEAFAALLARAPHLRLLVSSRIPLSSSAERTFAVGPMPTPAWDATPEELAQNDSAQLFLDRARRGARPDMQATPRNAAALAQICRHLEGIPLAIELCAASAHALAPAQMLERLRAGAEMPSRQKRDIPERHHSLQTVLAATCDLLSPAQRRLLGGLSFFRGAWTVETAEVICPTPDTLADMMALAEAALIRPEEGEDDLRFTMLQTLRQFVPQLLEPDEATQIETRYDDFFTDLAIGFPRDRDRDEIAALERIGAERDNLRAVVARAFEKGDFDRVLQIAVALEGFWQMRGDGREMLEWLETALREDDASPHRWAAMAIRGGLAVEYRGYAAAADLLKEARGAAEAAHQPLAQAQALYHLGRLAYTQGDYDVSEKRLEEAFALRAAASDTTGMAKARHALGQIAQCKEEWEVAQTHYQEATTFARRTGRLSLIADVLYDMAHLAMALDELATAVPMLHECAGYAERLGAPRLQAKIWNNLGEIGRRRGDDRDAQSAYLKSARIFCRLREGVPLHFPLWNLGCLFLKAEEYDAGLPLIVCAVRLWEDVGRPIDAESEMFLGQQRALLSRFVGPVTEGFWWEKGRSLTMDEAVALAEERASEATRPPSLPGKSGAVRK